MQTNQPRQTTATKDKSIDKLRECFRDELSAVETYQMALSSVTHVGVRRTLQEILASHDRRTEVLRERIARSGAEPPNSSGVWGAFAKALQAGADLLGDRTAISALEEGEDRTLALYTDGVDQCDARTLRFIDTELLPEQRYTHDLCQTLKAYVTAPS